MSRHRWAIETLLDAEAASPSALDEASAHLTDCAQCREELAAFLELRQVAQELPPEAEELWSSDTGGGIGWAKVRAEMRGGRSRLLPPITRIARWVPLAAAAAIGLMWLGGRGVLAPDPTPETASGFALVGFESEEALVQEILTELQPTAAFTPIAARWNVLEIELLRLSFLLEESPEDDDLQREIADVLFRRLDLLHEVFRAAEIPVVTLSGALQS